jgi:hypothetical protein
MGRQRSRLLATLAAMAAVAVVAAGCGSASSSKSGGASSSKSGSASSSKSAQVPTVSLSRAADVSSSAAGFRLAMTLHETIPSEGVVNLRATGSFSPAAHTGAMTMDMNLPSGTGLNTLALQMVLTKSTVYVKLPAELASKIPGGKPWLYVNLAQAGEAAGIPGLGSLMSSSSSLSNPGEYLTFLHATSDGTVQDLGQATVNGVATTHYHAEIDLQKLPDAVPSSDRQSVEQLVAALQKKGATTTLPIDAWIDSSHLIRRIQMNFSEPVSTGQAVTVALTENFLQYGAQPAPTVPSPSQSANLFSLAHGST